MQVAKEFILDVAGDVQGSIGAPDLQRIGLTEVDLP